MSRDGLTLRKVLAKDQTSDYYQSALWEVEELPGLRIRQMWDHSIKNNKAWIVYNRLALQMRGELSEQVLHIARTLQDQRFSTRREALQALEVIMMLEES